MAETRINSNIKEIFNNIWTGNIEKLYKGDGISNEAQLQAELYSILKTEKSDLYDKVWLEVSTEGVDKKYFPDMVLTKGKEIVAIVELKFVPNNYPVYEWDLNKLEDLYSNKNLDSYKIYIEIDHNTGQSKSPDFKITESTIFIFASIGNYESAAMQPLKTKIPQENFLQLIGSIQKNKVIFKSIEVNENPIIWIPGKPVSRFKTKGDKETVISWRTAIIEKTKDLPVLEIGAYHVDIEFHLEKDQFPKDYPYGPDLDNLLKLLFDSLNQTIFKNLKGQDSAIVSLNVKKTQAGKETGVNLRFDKIEG